MRWILIAMAASTMMTAGCRNMAAATQDTGAQRPARIDNTVADWPLKFVQHNFGVLVFSAYGCTVDYNGFRHWSDPDDVLRPPLSGAHPDTVKNASAGYLGVMNFPAPAHVRWRSMDGQAHEAEVDIGEIFKDQLIMHNVPREEIRDDVSTGNPDVLLEVNDRTINVYMRALVPTKRLQSVGGVARSSSRDMVLAWTRTY